MASSSSSSSSSPSSSVDESSLVLHEVPCFKLERFFAPLEFSVRHLLSCSDCESLRVDELLGMAATRETTRAALSSLSLAYTDTIGARVLRDEIVRATALRHVAADQLLVCAPEEAILLAMRVLVGAGDHVVCMFPGYQSLYDLARRERGAHVSFWRARERRRRPLDALDADTVAVADTDDEQALFEWYFALDDLRAELDALRARGTPARLLAVNLPHNPTGWTPSAAEFSSLLALATEHRLTVFCDEMYRGLERDERTQLPSLADVYTGGASASLAGVSKSLSAPGLRIGWLATRSARLHAALVAAKDWTTICPPAPSELLALAALENADEIRTRNRALVADNWRAYAALCDEHPRALCRCAPPRAGSTAFVRIDAAALGFTSVLAMTRALHRERSTMLLPASVFDDDNAGEATLFDERASSFSHCRLGLGRRAFGSALDELRAFVVEHLATSAATAASSSSSSNTATDGRNPNAASPSDAE